MWAFIASWFTPSSLFLFLNLVIGTIVLTARYGTQKSQTHQYDQRGPYESTQLVRAPSLLDRVKSINFSLYKFDPPSVETEYHQHPTEPEYVTHYPNQENQPQLARAPSLLERLKSINLSSIYRSEQPETDQESDTEDEAPGPNPFEDQSHDHSTPVKRSKSESRGGGHGKKSQVEKMTKSTSEKSALGISSHGEEDDVDAVERLRPATTRVEKTKRSVKAGEKVSSWESDDGVDAKADDFINRFKQQLKLQRLESLKRFSEMLKGK